MAASGLGIRQLKRLNTALLGNFYGHVQWKVMVCGKMLSGLNIELISMDGIPKTQWPGRIF